MIDFMQKLIQMSLIGVAVLLSITATYAGNPDDKPTHGGYSGLVETDGDRARSAVLDSVDITGTIARYLDPASFGAFASSCQAVAPLGRDPILGFQIDKNGYPVYDKKGNRVGYTAQVSQEFASLGRLYTFHVPAHHSEAHKEWNGQEIVDVPARDVAAQDLILSGEAPMKMTHQQAVAYCASLGSGSRLPTEQEYISLSRSKGSLQPDRRAAGFRLDGYNPYLLFKNMRYKWYWSLTIDFSGVAVEPFFFDGNHGSVLTDRSDLRLSVQCVH